MNTSYKLPVLDVEKGFRWVKTLAAILGGVLTFMNAKAGGAEPVAILGMTIGLLMVEAGLIYAGLALKNGTCTDAQKPWLEGMVYAASLFIFVDFSLVIAREQGDPVGWFGYLVGIEAGIMLVLITKALLADARRQAQMFRNGVHARTVYEQLQNAYGELVLEMDYARDQRYIKQKQRQKMRRRMLRRLTGGVFDSHGIRLNRNTALNISAKKINGQTVELLGLTHQERGARIDQLAEEISQKDVTHILSVGTNGVGSDKRRKSTIEGK